MFFRTTSRKYYGTRITVSCTMMLLILMIGGISGKALGASKTAAEIALYQGADREKMLIEGAKKEGEIILYTSLSNFRIFAQAFEKKFPFIKVKDWRSSSQELYKRVVEEYAAGHFLVDVIEFTDLMEFLNRKGILQEFYSPELRHYADEDKVKGKRGVFYAADREIYIGLGYNTKLVSATEAPKTLKDLLDPKWKGKMSIAVTKTGITWVGNVLETMGREFMEKLSLQDIKIQNISGNALTGLISSGEVMLSPTAFDSTCYAAKQKGASIEWRPLEPVIANVGYAGMTSKASHPHASLLFLDYLYAEEGQKVLMKDGVSSPREDIDSTIKKFKKTNFTMKYSPEEFEKKYNEWEDLMKRLFIKRK